MAARRMHPETSHVYRVRLVSAWSDVEGAAPDEYLGPYVYESAARRNAEEHRASPLYSDAIVEACPLPGWSPA
jgi:hypothetical protein